MRKIEKLIVHCSASDNPEQDSPKAIWHLHTAPKTEKIKWGEYNTTGNGWSDIGYHIIITTDGDVHNGRPIGKVGAHCKGQNEDSVGICLTGINKFTSAQFESLIDLLKDLTEKYGLFNSQVFGHYEFDIKKTCPNLNMDFIRSLL
jgi:N-acetyl-anhydromuramyl-L-alanine amidase AmpD